MRLFEFERKDMPQIKPEDIVDDFEHSEHEVSVAVLKPIQTDRKKKAAKKAMDAMKTGLYKPLIVDMNGYIIDGHHRYDAAKELGKEEVRVIMLKAKYPDILDKLGSVDEGKEDQVTMKDKAKRSKPVKGGQSPHPFRGKLVGG